MQKWVTDAKILQGGSNFPRNIFDPSALHEEVLPQEAPGTECAHLHGPCSRSPPVVMLPK